MSLCGAEGWCPLFQSTAMQCGVADNVAVNKKAGERTHNTYDVNEDKEQKRLNFQLDLTRDIDVSILKPALQGIEKPVIMDIGCNNGAWLLDRLKAMDLTCQAVGVDIDEQILQNANNKFPQMLTIRADCESADFALQVYEKVPTDVRFDAVILSMLLLHTKNPLNVLKNARKMLKKDGFIYIRDMDDGLSVAYPDKNGVFARIIKICDAVAYTGYRRSGREIYGLLQQTGYTDIKSVPVVMDVTRAEPNDYDFRENLYTVNFGFLLEDTHRAAADNIEHFGMDYTWLKNTGLNTLNEMFHTAEFYYRMGLVCYTARR